jgi:hypothetical protein
MTYFEGCHKQRVCGGISKFRTAWLSHLKGVGCNLGSFLVFCHDLQTHLQQFGVFRRAPGARTILAMIIDESFG